MTASMDYFRDKKEVEGSADDLEVLRSVLRKKVKEASMKAGLALNLQKTKLMSTQDIKEFKVDDEDMEVVETFLFLGFLIDRYHDSSPLKYTKLQHSIKKKVKLISRWTFPSVPFTSSDLDCSPSPLLVVSCS